MFCRNCGNPLPENSKFCGICGAPVENAAPDFTTPAAPVTPPPKKKTGNVFLIIIIAVVIVCMILALTFLLKGILSSEETVSENTTSGNTISENTDSGNTTSGNTDSENADSGNTASKKTVTLLSEITFTGEDGETRLSRTYTYDENGLLTGMVYYDELDQTDRTEFTVNEDGKVLNRKQYVDNDLSINFYYTYDSDGNLLTLSSYNGDSLNQEINYTYEDGKLLQTTDYSSSSDTTETTVYTYTESGNNVSYSTYDDSGAVTATGEQTCDADGNVLTDTIYDSDGNLRSTLESTYYNNGRRKSYSQKSQWNTSSCDYGTAVSMTYDEDGHVLTNKHYSDGFGFLSQLTYDEYGNPLSETTWFLYGESDEEDLTDSADSVTNVYEYTYDSDGNILTAVHTCGDDSYMLVSYNDGSWTMQGCSEEYSGTYEYKYTTMDISTSD